MDAYQAKEQPPNVILIITDDQGYGDFGFTGNPHVQTPQLDQLAEESIRLNNFYVSPVCAPTRSSLMTGRYSLRTGVRDTYNGGATMATEEITLAEMLKDAGYATGIFGKWHLGDNYPFRPGDQGFDESLIHLSGGMVSRVILQPILKWTEVILTLRFGTTVNRNLFLAIVRIYLPMRPSTL